MYIDEGILNLKVYDFEKEILKFNVNQNFKFNFKIIKINEFAQ